MEAKISLYDANEVKIGETFMRRAKQLVKQQRAEWMDESYNAIKFAQDTDEFSGQDSESAAESSDKWLVALAEQRIKERGRFILHSVLALPTWFILFVLFGNATRTLELSFFITGVCLTSYLIHAYQFAYPRIFKSSLQGREGHVLNL